MSKVTYEIVEHDGGWTYRVNGVFSEPFPSHDFAAKRQSAPPAGNRSLGDTTRISHEDKSGHWHDELASGCAWLNTELVG